MLQSPISKILGNLQVLPLNQKSKSKSKISSSQLCLALISAVEKKGVEESTRKDPSSWKRLLQWKYRSWVSHWYFSAGTTMKLAKNYRWWMTTPAWNLARYCDIFMLFRPPPLHPPQQHLEVYLGRQRASLHLLKTKGKNTVRNTCKTSRVILLNSDSIKQPNSKCCCIHLNTFFSCSHYKNWMVQTQFSLIKAIRLLCWGKLHSH